MELDYLYLDGTGFRYHPGARTGLVLVAYGITTAATPTSPPVLAAGPPHRQAGRRPWPWVTDVLVIAWHLLTDDCDDADLGVDYFVRRDADRARQRTAAQLQALGYQVTLQPLAAGRRILLSEIGLPPQRNVWFAFLLGRR
jgi:hypothetical protein